MAPTTNEAELEKEVSELINNIKDIDYQIRMLRSKLDDLISDRVENEVNCRAKVEELRKFRAMYPNLSKETKE